MYLTQSHRLYNSDTKRLNETLQHTKSKGEVKLEIKNSVLEWQVFFVLDS